MVLQDAQGQGQGQPLPFRQPVGRLFCEVIGPGLPVQRQVDVQLLLVDGLVRQGACKLPEADFTPVVLPFGAPLAEVEGGVCIKRGAVPQELGVGVEVQPALLLQLLPDGCPGLLAQDVCKLINGQLLRRFQHVLAGLPVQDAVAAQGRIFGAQLVAGVQGFPVVMGLVQGEDGGREAGRRIPGDCDGVLVVRGGVAQLLQPLPVVCLLGKAIKDPQAGGDGG